MIAPLGTPSAMPAHRAPIVLGPRPPREIWSTGGYSKIVVVPPAYTHLYRPLHKSSLPLGGRKIHHGMPAPPPSPSP